MERFVEEMVVTDFGGNGGVLAVGMSGVALTELMLNQLAIQGAHAVYGKVLEATKALFADSNAKGLELQAGARIVGRAAPDDGNEQSC